MSQDELLFDVDLVETGTADGTSPGPGDSTRDASRRGSHTEKSRSHATDTAGALAREPFRHVRPQLRTDDVLPRHYFLKQLEREKRRADRSKAPLSIVLFHFECRVGDLLGEVDRLLEVLCSIKRETDIVGYLSDDRIAVLVPDTGKQGARMVVRKVLASAGHLGFSSVATTYPDRIFDDLNAEDIKDPNPFFPENLAGAGKGSYVLKRSLDIVGAVAALLLLSPLMLLIAIAVVITSPGPAIFKQVRLGRRGVPFTFYKFRSMYCEANDQIHREYVTKLIKGDLEAIDNGEAAKPLYKMKDDRRITRVGKILRKTSMDELPQLFNVLKGDMSLVGPRPPLVYEVEKYQSWHLRRILEIKPGITGLWQVNGRSKTSFDEMVRLDLQYVRNCSLLLDCKLLLKTFKAVLHDEGAT
jgi:exopolysaccharide biosynthesis polyprenyl glycosylphosphotransferase